MFDTTEWTRSALILALLFPSTLTSLIFALSALIWGKTALGILWFGVSAPLVFLDGYSSFERDAIEVPFETYEIPRAIPKQTFMSMNWFSYVSAFLLVVFVIMMIMCAEIAVVFQLRSKDYKWWWRAFSNGGSPALYLFVYSVFYLFTGVGILCICDLVLRVRASRVVCFLYGDRRHCLLFSRRVLSLWRPAPLPSTPASGLS